MKDMKQDDTTLKIFFDPSVKELIDSIALSFNVRITFFSVTRDEYLVGYHLQDSDFCSMIQSKLGIRYRCLALDTRMCAKCKRLGERIVYRCHAGLSEVIVPVYIEKKLMAFACLGQFRMSDDIPHEMTTLWKEHGYPEEELRKAFFERPKYTEEQLKRILYIFSTSIEYLLSTSRLKLRKPQLGGAPHLLHHRLPHGPDPRAGDLHLPDAGGGTHAGKSGPHQSKIRSGKMTEQNLPLRRRGRFFHLW